MGYRASFDLFKSAHLRYDRTDRKGALRAQGEDVTGNTRGLDGLLSEDLSGGWSLKPGWVRRLCCVRCAL